MMVELTYPAYVVESNLGPYWRECALDQNMQVCGFFWWNPITTFIATFLASRFSFEMR